MFTIDNTPVAPESTLVLPPPPSQPLSPAKATLTKPSRKARAAGRELRPTHAEYDEVALLTSQAGMVRLDIDATAGDGEWERACCILSAAQAMKLKEQLTRAISEAEGQRLKGGR